MGTNLSGVNPAYPVAVNDATPANSRDTRFCLFSRNKTTKLMEYR
jgi:hypothetical protein